MRPVKDWLFVCRKCGAYTTKVEAVLRKLNTGLCACGGDLKLRLNPEEAKSARWNTARHAPGNTDL